MITMETITITIDKASVFDEVAKATDYTGSKLPGDDQEARDRILMSDADQADLGRFWEESAMAVNETFKQMLLSGSTDSTSYTARLEVSKSFDTALTSSVESTIKSYFIASIIGQWFKFANKGEASEYFSQAAEQLLAAERLLYSRKKPTIPTN